MRHKMRQHLDKSSASRVDIKQGQGTIADIEFLTQYWCLLKGHEYPEVVLWSDNVRIIDALKYCEVISQSWAQQLTEAYLAFRNQAHQKALDGRENMLADDELQEHRNNVICIWKSVFNEQN